MDAARARFSPDESAVLLIALVAEVARVAGSRVLVIKGEAAVYHRLRAPRLSGDVDVMVAPDESDDLIAALNRLGWERTRRSELARAVVGHATTLEHPRWPSTLDVHSYFPGLAAIPSDVFDALWREREPMPAAGAVAQTTSWRHAALILAANALRGGLTAARDIDEVRGVRRVVLARGSDSVAEIAEAAGPLGCQSTLAPFLRSLGGAAGLVARDSAATESERDWWDRVGSGGAMVAAERRHLMRQPVRQRFAVAWRLVWPPVDELRLEYPDAQLDGRDATVFRVRRLVRGTSDAVRWLDPRRRRDAERLYAIIAETL